MPILPNLVERTLLRTNRVPGVMMDLLGTITFRAVVAGLRLRLFEALAGGRQRTADLASRLACSESGLNHLLELLAATGYVKRTAGGYENTPATARWLARESRDSIIAFVDLWQGILFDLWDNLEDSIRAGQPALHMHDWLSQLPEGWPTFNAAMRAAGRTGAEEVARRLALSDDVRRVLDVGGSHGLFSAALCLRYPQISATVFDLPQALEATRRTIAEQGLEEQMSTQAGDMMRDTFGTGYDVVLLFNVIHYFSPEQNTTLLRKAAAALNADGLVVLMDQLADRAPLPSARAFVSALSLQYFATLGSRVYRFEEISAWLRDAGFGKPRRRGLRNTPGQYLLIAQRAG